MSGRDITNPVSCVSKLWWVNSMEFKLEWIWHNVRCSSFIILTLRRKCSKERSSVCFTLFHSDCTITTLVTRLSFSALIFKGAIIRCPAFTLISPANIHPGSLLEVSSNIIMVEVSLLVCGPKPSVSSAGEWPSRTTVAYGVIMSFHVMSFCCIN